MANAFSDHSILEVELDRKKSKSSGHFQKDAEANCRGADFLAFGLMLCRAFD